MSERLSTDDSIEALVLYQNHEATDRDVRLANNNRESVLRKNEALIKSGVLLAESDAAEEYEANDEVRNAQNAHDANLWRAQQHKNEHLDQYIETARQEAEAQGIHIDLELPKE